jgi:hypothetical protein
MSAIGARLGDLRLHPAAADLESIKTRSAAPALAAMGADVFIYPDERSEGMPPWMG